MCINTYPSIENFETAPVWTVGGTNSDWTWGTPSKPVITGAGGGLKCWVIAGLTGSSYKNSEQSYIYSPCYDFTNLTYPHVAFKIFWESERKYDGGNFQYSLNGGTTWANVGGFGDPIDCMNDNWFNYSNIKFLNTPAWITTNEGWSGNIQATAGTCQGGFGSGGWVVAQHCLTGLAGKPSVIFRFTFGSGTTCNSYDGFAIDDFTIENGVPNAPDFNYACSGSNIISFTGINPLCPIPSSYQWNFGEPSSGTNNISTIPNPNHVYSAPGSYVVTLTTSGGPCNPAATMSKTILVMSSSITSQTNLNCFGATNGSATVTTVNGITPLTYSWSPSGGTAQTGTNLSSGSYTVFVSDAKGCKQNTIVTITQPLQITINVQQIPSACGSNNGVAIAVASNGIGSFNYLWSNNATGTTASNLSAAIYTVTVTDANSCTQTTIATISTAGGGIAVAAIQSGVTCNGGNDGIVSATMNGGTPMYTYSWSNGTSSQTATNLTQGSYTITIKDANGCASTSTVTVTEPLTIIASVLTLPSTCNASDGTALVTANGGTGLLTYYWSNNATGQTNSNIPAGVYSVTVKDANSCSKTEVATVPNKNGTAATTAVATPISCNGASDGSVKAISSGGTAPYTYIWSSTSQTGAVAINLNAGTYTVTVSDAAGCTIVSSIVLIQPPPIIISSSVKNTTCVPNNGNVTAIVTGGIPMYTYGWSTGVTVVTNATSEQLNNLVAGNYSATITDANNCSATVKAILSNVNLGVITGIPAQQTINRGDSVALIASGAVTYNWSPGAGLSCTNCPNPLVTTTVTTTYTVTATDINGCSVTAMITIIVKTPCVDNETDLFIANVFSPNNDGQNDVVYIEGSGLTNIYWGIYDRWGNLLFEAYDQAHGWDGTKNGNRVDIGNYPYYLKATCIRTNSEVRLKGNISIIR